MTSRTWLLLGSNIGNPALALDKAKTAIGKKIGTIVRQSSLYRTAAWGNIHQPTFLNQVVIVETSLSAMQTMQQILSIEEKMGRIRTTKNAPRIIDIDILFFNKTVCRSPGLTVPHPLIRERNFVLVPMNELSPNLKHPVLQKTMHRLMLECRDSLAVKKI
jgi:2-amino-4-hydroxy-6-hydroxymethyldihydropteridine diphosphokinase